MVDPALIGGVVGVVSIIAAGGYAYVTGESASAGADIDNDGEDEASVSFNENAPYQSTPNESEDATDDEEATRKHVKVSEKDYLTEVKGIQETRAENLRSQGYYTPTDLYYATNDNLEDVSQIGPYTVEQIREDIGSVDNDGSDE